MELEPAPAIQCPRCGYQRRDREIAPAWQCPSCGIAYAKAEPVNPAGTAHKRTVAVSSTRDGNRPRYLQRILSLAAIGSVIAMVAGWYFSSRLPDKSTIRPDLLRQPIQQKTDVKPFVFHYRGSDYQIQPQADYEIWGMIVSHNDITGFTDLTHNKNSVDFRDLCVIWGTNVRFNDYRRVSFSSGDFTCYVKYPRGAIFYPAQLSNNHLLTDDPVLRSRIENARIGDQIHMRGMLINYFPLQHPGWVRRTSLTRTDTGNGACEVLFVKDFDILKPGNALWYLLSRTGFWLFGILIFTKFVMFAWNSRNS